jgi:hypothetical protein
MMAPMAPDAVPRLPLHLWVREGLRAGVLMRARIGAAQPRAIELIALVVTWSALDVVLDRLSIAGDARFDLHGLLLSWWNAGAIVLLAFALLPRRDEADAPRGVAAWFALWITAIVPVSVAAQLLSIAQVNDLVPEFGPSWWPAAVQLAWIVAVTARMAVEFGLRPVARASLAAGVVALMVLSAWQFPDRPWLVENDPAAQENKPHLTLSQDTFEIQQNVWKQAVARLAAQRAGVVDVYGIVFSPYADDEVFLRESSMVAKLLAERFDAAARVMHLANHADTAESLPWATPQNLERAIEAIGGKMDREHDVLFVYLTSHGAKDFKLAASNPPLDVDTVSPGELRQALDNAGIRNRVIVISACYSGGWVGPIADEHTLVMTAADATHTSFGCGSGSQLTFFGRAVFDEQLRQTHSLEQAFAAAVPVIRKREQEAGKDDGFSNPQMLVGEKIRPVLRELEQRLDAGASK